jgi:hypothetical protein
MHLYNCICVVLLVPRLTLAFLSPKLSRGIDIVLVCLCPLDSITLGILLDESYYNCCMLADYSIWLKDRQQGYGLA